MFSIEVLKDERIVIIAEQRPDCPEEEVNSLTFTHFSCLTQLSMKFDMLINV